MIHFLETELRFLVDQLLYAQPYKEK